MVYLLGLVAALLLATGFVFQQHVAVDLPPRDRLSPRLLLDLVRHPLWLLGIATMVAGQICGALALDNGSLTVVEPLLAANLLFALPLAAAWTRRRLKARDLLGAAILIAGLATFMVAAGPANVVATAVPPMAWLIAGLSVVGTVAVMVTVAKRLERLDVAEEATLLGAGAGTLFGLQDALTQRTEILFTGHGVVAALSTWQPYALIAVAITGLILNQSAFAMAPLAASLPAVTIAEPLTGVGLGAGLFAEHLRLAPPYLAMQLVGLGLMILGVYMVARSPIVTSGAKAQAEHAAAIEHGEGGRAAAG